MAGVYRDDDVDLSGLAGRCVAVIGYGRLGQMHALCLRDSGVDVRVGLPEDDPERSAAEADGLRVVPPGQACAEADVVAMLSGWGLSGPSGADDAPYAPGAALILPDAVSAGRFAVPEKTSAKASKNDVSVIALQGSPAEARRRFNDGRGVPALIAVLHDATGTAQDLTLSYARALGTTRAGAVVTSPGELAFASEFAATALGPDRIGAMVAAAMSVLRESGCAPDVATLSCWTAVRDALDRISGATVGPPGRMPADEEELVRLRRVAAGLLHADQQYAG